MSTTEREHLASALLDVRRAWRLVYSYQRRVFDLLAEIDDLLEQKGLAFVSWSPMRTAAPARASTKVFTEKWAWDLLPGYALQCIWDDGAVKNGLRRRVLLQAVADTGWKYSGAEPDPAQFEDPAESCTSLWVGHWATTASVPDWKAAWEAMDQESEHAEVVVYGETYLKWTTGVDVADLVDAEAVSRQLLKPMAAWADDPSAR